MKILMLCVLSISTLFAGNPGNWLSVQGLLLQPSGQRASDGNHLACFSIFETPTGGTQVWSECDSIAVLDGFYQARLGDSIPLPLVSGKPAYVEVKLDGQTMTGRVALTGAVKAWSAAAVSDTVLPTAGIGPGLAVRSLNGLKDEITLATSGNLVLEIRSDTLLLRVSGELDSIRALQMDSALTHVHSPHLMFSGDSTKAVAERTATTSRNGILSATDFARFDSKGDLHSDSLSTLKFVPHSFGDGFPISYCGATVRGQMIFRKAFYTADGTDALVICLFDGATNSYRWTPLN
jgi:hypothetical protein